MLVGVASSLPHSHPLEHSILHYKQAKLPKPLQHSVCILTLTNAAVNGKTGITVEKGTASHRWSVIGAGVGWPVGWPQGHGIPAIKAFTEKGE